MNVNGKISVIASLYKQSQPPACITSAYLVSIRLIFSFMNNTASNVNQIPSHSNTPSQQPWFYRTSPQGTKQFSPSSQTPQASIENAILSLNNVLETERGAPAPPRILPQQIIQEEVLSPSPATSLIDPLQVKKQGEGFVSHWKITNAKLKKPYQTIDIIRPTSLQPINTNFQQTPQVSTNWASQQHSGNYTPTSYDTPTQFYEEVYSPSRQKYFEKSPSTPNYQSQTLQQITQSSQQSQPQQYIEYSFVSHNSKGKRGRRKKSVTIMSTQNPFGGTFVDNSPATMSPRQFTNIPNKTFTIYTPPTGVTKKSKSKPNVPRIDIKSPVSITSPTIVTSSTTEDMVMVTQPNPIDNPSNQMQPDKSDQDNQAPPEPGTPSSIAEPMTPTGEDQDGAKYDRVKLRRVSIKNLLCS